ncbi:MAG: ligase-associated DNA damage response endonuclease PdeM [Flammeovirgaceae bacterium]|nr:ligase-associated DNA damage response endonuclease PdeM [Flammeovirgaceae bacterium]
MEIQLLKNKIELLPQKAIWLKHKKTVLMADLHFGKINHFRKAGIPVPARANDKNAESLIAVLQATKPERVIFLGDLFHSHYNEDWEVLGQIRKNFINCSFELVLGNHDILSALQYERNQMKCYANELREGDFILTHEPMPDVPEGLYNLSGHFHPGVTLRGSGKQSVMLPCFYFGQNQGILPAFGSFTGMARIMPRKEDRVFVIAEDKIIDYSHGQI